MGRRQSLLEDQYLGAKGNSSRRSRARGQDQAEGQGQGRARLEVEISAREAEALKGTCDGAYGL